MKNLGFALAGITAMLIGGGQANATVCSSTITMPTGDGHEFFSALGAGVCVQAQDKLFSNFSFGNLVANGTVTFDLEVIDGTENHNITFTDSFVAGHSYTGFGYDVATTPPGSPIVGLFADFTQSRGGATTLIKTTTPVGVGSIDIIKTGINASGTNEIDYPGGVQSLAVTESLTVGANSDVSAILNTVVQDVAEPASLGLLGVALVGFGAIRRRRKSA
jgi:hypothetical protein